MKLKRSFAPLLPILVGVISLGLTLWLWTHERQTEEANLRASFDFGLRQATSRIEQRMAGYEQMVRGTQGLLAASDRVDRQRFSTYVDALLAGPGADGLQALVYAPLLKADGAAAHVDAQHAAGVAGYAIRPRGGRAEFAPATYIAPAIGNQLKVLGYDPFSDPVRR